VQAFDKCLSNLNHWLQELNDNSHTSGGAANVHNDSTGKQLT